MADLWLTQGGAFTDTGTDQWVLNGVLFEPTVTGGAIAGSTTLTFTTSASLTGLGALAGASSLTFTTAGALSGTGSLSGASTITFAGAAALAGTGAMAGSSSITFTTSGVLGDGLSVVSYISGSSSLTFTATGAIRGIRYSLRAVRIARSGPLNRTGVSRTINRFTPGRR